jgi:hypothetical protein
LLMNLLQAAKMAFDLGWPYTNMMQDCICVQICSSHHDRPMYIVTTLFQSERGCESTTQGLIQKLLHHFPRAWGDDYHRSRLQMEKRLKRIFTSTWMCWKPHYVRLITRWQMKARVFFFPDSQDRPLNLRAPFSKWPCYIM